MNNYKLWLLLTVACVLLAAVFGELGLKAIPFAFAALAMLFFGILMVLFLNNGGK